jgi:hypothetical protein
MSLARRIFYGSERSIIVREEGVNFPSDFSDLGYITFKDGEIASWALEILKESLSRWGS